MNQREWYSYLQTVKRRHYAEIAEVKRLQQLEIRRIEQEMAKAEPTEDFQFSIMRAIEVNQMMDTASEYQLLA